MQLNKFDNVAPVLNRAFKESLKTQLETALTNDMYDKEKKHILASIHSGRSLTHKLSTFMSFRNPFDTYQDSRYSEPKWSHDFSNQFRLVYSVQNKNLFVSEFYRDLTNKVNGIVFSDTLTNKYYLNLNVSCDLKNEITSGRLDYKGFSFLGDDLYLVKDRTSVELNCL